MVLEMFKNFPGLGDIKMLEDGKASVTFSSLKDAQTAVSGKIIFRLILKGMHNFRLSEEGAKNLVVRLN